MFGLHHFSTSSKARNLKTFFSSYSDLLLGIFSQSGINLLGYLFIALLPVMLSEYLGGEKNAGIMISIFMGIQAFVFTPLGGKLMEKYSLVGLYKISLVIEIVGALLWVFLPNKLGILCFAAGIFFRMAILATDPLILRLAPRDKGGFWFGLRDEISAFSVYSGLLLFPLFLLPESWELLPLIILGVEIMMFGLIMQIKDQIEPLKENRETSSADFFSPFRKAFTFIKKNHNYPLFYLGTSIFEGVFYGGIWFLFPLYISTFITDGGEYTLGIYELVTVLFSLVCGVMADRYSWKKIEGFAWGITIILSWAFVLFTSIYSLILIGFFIGLSNNFFAAASYHALAEFNNDPQDEKSFTMVGRVIMSMGYMTSPLVCGILYQYFGFSMAMVFLASCVSILGVWMLYVLYKVRK